MRYTIFVLAILLITSSIALRMRNKAKLHTQSVCSYYHKLDAEYTTADGECYDEQMTEIQAQGGTEDDIDDDVYDACLATKLGYSSYDELHQEYMNLWRYCNGYN